jgi:hypothetical protein
MTELRKNPHSPTQLLDDAERYCSSQYHRDKWSITQDSGNYSLRYSGVWIASGGSNLLAAQWSLERIGASRKLGGDRLIWC